MCSKEQKLWSFLRIIKSKHEENAEVSKCYTNIPRTHPELRVCVCVCLCLCECVCVYKHKHTHTHTHIYIYIYMRTAQNFRSEENYFVYFMVNNLIPITSSTWLHSAQNLGITALVWYKHDYWWITWLT